MTRYGLIAILNNLWQTHILLFFFMTFCITPYSQKLQGKLSFVQNGVVSKKIWHFYLEISNYP
jgi:hypothetical protein